MAELLVQVKNREGLGRGAARRLRREGYVPAIIYGAKLDPRPVGIDPKMLLNILHSESGMNTIFQLNLEGTERRRHVMIKDYQVDPVEGHLLHADLIRIQMDEVIDVMVPIYIEGESQGVKLDGGILDHVNREVEVSCLPSDIPEHISVNVTELKIGDAIRVSDLSKSEKYTILADPEQTLIVISAPVKEEEVAAVTEEVAAPVEPEVMKKGKAATEGEEAEGTDDAKKEEKKPGDKS